MFSFPFCFCKLTTLQTNKFHILEMFLPSDANIYIFIQTTTKNKQQYAFLLQYVCTYLVFLYEGSN